MDKIKFGTGGFRGIIGETFTKENVQKICQSICNIVKRKQLKKQICIGFDNRFMSEFFAKWSAQVFACNGFSVELTDTSCATPVIMFETMKQGNDYGLMITASHNPFMYNGVKIFTGEGKDASVEETKEIEEEFYKISDILACSEDDFDEKIKLVNYNEQFVDYIVNNQKIGDITNLKVVFDCKYGSSAEEIKLFCKKINLEDYEIINGNRDAFFSFTTPAPSSENIGELQDRVKSSGADIGFALDADGDRLAVVDKNGIFFDNNIILSLVYYYMVKYENKQGDVIKNCATTGLLDILAEKFGYNCHEVPVGFKYISSKLKETDGVVGGESSGGLAISSHIWGKDSLISIALCLKILHKLNKPFNQIVEEMLAFADDYKKVVFDRQYSYSAEKEADIKRLLFETESLPELKHKVVKIVKNDYLKIFYENGNWALIRFSGTEPILRIFTEFENKQECEEETLMWEKFLGI